MEKMLKPDGTEIIDLDRITKAVVSPEDRDLLMDIFDKTNVADVMARCLDQIYPLYANEHNAEDWLIQRINSYMAVKNFETVVDLLRQLTLARTDSERTDEQEQRIFDLTIEIIRATEEEYDFRESFKRALDILVEIIQKHPALYTLHGDSSMSVLLKRLFLNYQEGSEWDILTNVVVIAGFAGDKSFLPDIEKFLLEEQKGLGKFRITPFSATHNDKKYRLRGVCFHVIANLGNKRT